MYISKLPTSKLIHRFISTATLIVKVKNTRTTSQISTMENLQKTVEEVTEQLNKRMAQFDSELAAARASPNMPHTLDSLAADFSSFRSDTISTLSNLQSIVAFLAKDVERLEIRSRRKILLLHGVDEQKEESAAAVATSVFAECLDFEVGPDDVSRCQRMGRATGEKPRPLLVKFKDVARRDQVWFAKKLFKGSGKTLSEFLIVSRHKLFMAARTKLGVSSCWTRGGEIFCITADGKKRSIASFAELDSIDGPSVASNVTADTDKQGKSSAQFSNMQTRKRALLGNKK